MIFSPHPSVVEVVLLLLVNEGRNPSHLCTSPNCLSCTLYRPLVVALLSIFFTRLIVMQNLPMLWVLAVPCYKGEDDFLAFQLGSDVLV